MPTRTRLALRPIGYVKNGVNDIGFKGWKDLVSRLVIDERFSEALDGIEHFSHLFVIFMLHLPGKLLLRRHPRDRQDLPVVGVFATRSQMRPNRLGLQAVRLLERRESELLVRGLDAIDGTPVIDIKPYMPRLDIVADASVPSWVEKLESRHLPEE